MVEHVLEDYPDPVAAETVKDWFTANKPGGAAYTQHMQLAKDMGAHMTDSDYNDGSCAESTDVEVEDLTLEDLKYNWGAVGQLKVTNLISPTGLQPFGPAMKCPFPRVDVLIAGGASCNTA